VFVILVEHAWIESGETVSDDLLLDLGVSDTRPVMIEARLVWHRRLGKNIVVFAREITPADAMISKNQQDERGTNHNWPKNPPKTAWPPSFSSKLSRSLAKP
jgi:hypothetical protein